MSAELERTTVFVALTRPQMLAGVTYSFFIFNGIIAAELFLIFKSFWALFAAAIIHLIGVTLCLHDPRIFDIWIKRVSRCPRIRNFKLWQCNSYLP